MNDRQKKMAEARQRTVNIRSRLLALGLSPEVYFEENMQVRINIETLSRLTGMAEQGRRTEPHE